MPAHIAFVCLHGSAKSVIAAEYARRAADAAGVGLVTSAAGEEPDAALPPYVTAGLAARGIDVASRVPQPLSREHLAGADLVVSFGPDVSALAPPGCAVERWEDCPAVSEGFDPAWDVITARVDQLLRTRYAR